MMKPVLSLSPIHLKRPSLEAQWNGNADYEILIGTNPSNKMKSEEGQTLTLNSVLFQKMMSRYPSCPQ